MEPSSRPSVFVIDSDANQVAVLTAQLERSRRFRTEGFSSSVEALECIRVDPPDLIVCQMRMPRVDGIELTRQVREVHEALPIILTTEDGRAEDAERAFAAGASDVVSKPIEAGMLATRLGRLLEEAPARELMSSVQRTKFDPEAIVGDHPLIEAVRSFIQQVASVPQISVLLLGESGTGKNLVARAVHGAANLDARFVEINCAALSESHLETELFGYERGVSPEATHAKRGLVEVADGGTLFLDEIAAMPFELQAKLLSFLESRTFRRLGSTDERSVSLRIIAATNTNLARAVEEGRFREDLYYRLNVASHTLPPLRAVRSDIPRLVRFFVERAAHYFAKPVPEVDPDSLSRLKEHGWPGNYRELRNVIERALIFNTGKVLHIDVPHGPDRGRTEGGVHLPLGLTLEEVERRYLEAALQESGDTMNQLADTLGVSRKVLWQRRKRHGLAVNERNQSGDGDEEE